MKFVYLIILGLTFGVVSLPLYASNPHLKQNQVQAKEHEGQPAERININTADAKVLSELKGIGEKKAEAIVAYREKHGKFASVDELTQVKGITPKILGVNRDRLTS